MDLMQELRLDIAELEKLLNQAERQRVKDILSLEIRKLGTEIVKKEEALKQQEVSQHVQQAPKVAVQSAVIPTVQEKTYAWDQSDKYMKIYATAQGVKEIPKENIDCEYTSRSFRLRVSNLNNKNYEWHVANLMEDIIPQDSYFKIKKDMVLVMLKKKDTGKTWAYVTEREHKAKETKKPKVDETKDPNESLMDMLKQMYEDGDDDMKRTIGKAWSESRNKNPTL